MPDTLTSHTSILLTTWTDSLVTVDLLVFDKYPTTRIRTICAIGSAELDSLLLKLLDDFWRQEMAFWIDRHLAAFGREEILVDDSGLEESLQTNTTVNGFAASQHHNFCYWKLVETGGTEGELVARVLERTGGIGRLWNLAIVHSGQTCWA
jgi:hypothetical protein